MNFNQRHYVVSRRPTLPPLSNRTLHHRPTLPPLSNRTLHHPSFHPLYMISGLENHNTHCYNHTVHPIITPAELFYTDPSMICGRRIPNVVSELRVLNCFQLNTPPPLMSACQAPSVHPDPFRSGPNPTVDLGGLTLKMDRLRPQVKPSLLVLQITQEEDDTITNLLKLHYQEPDQSDEPSESTSPECASKPLHPNEASLLGHEGRCWSETELEAANTLLNGFSLMEDETSAETLPHPLPDLPQGSKTSPASTQNVQEEGGPGCGDYLSQCRLSISENVLDTKKQMLSDSEGDAVCVLLSLGDMAAQ
ncbi:uncharacterized protein LOC117807332 isoform X2 [Notolabrus celidotus]|uniref:uncharacterized protein LOC117807332 isoform X2 n=1 Tax=Notolabrus celidotus TaxID=1203425 RepID=UPI00148FE19B|nr:uncharacterized protein LOC117807332 isoform X2 [Notolabrus celidotus]